MNKRKHYTNSQGGFTLVELLIVIVIIGILAGVVIGTLNPIQQQNRARDGAVRSQLDKMALAGKGLFVSSPRSTNRSPTPAEFIGGLANATADGASSANCTNNTPNNASIICTFSLAGQTLPTDCTASSYTGTGGATQCTFAFWRSTTSFQVVGRGAATPVATFVYSYVENPTTGAVTEGFYTCPTTFTAGGSVAGCTLLN